MTRNELIVKIENGRDIMFDVSGKHFTILTWVEGGIGIGEQFPNDDKFFVYPTAEELVDKFLVNGVPLGRLTKGIVITDYT